MTGTQRMRASWGASRARVRDMLRKSRELELQLCEQHDAGRRIGYRVRDREYRRVCDTSPDMRYINLQDPPKHDHVEVVISDEVGFLSEPGFSYRCPTVQVTRAMFVPERQVWSDGRVVVQWWTWKFRGMSR